MRLAILAAVLLLAASPLPSHAADDLLPNLPPAVRVHALTHARIIPAPGEVLEDATLVLRDGRIEALGKGIVVPPDALTWDLSGKTIYAGLIDPFTSLGVPGAPRRSDDDEAELGRRRPRPQAPEPVAGAAHDNPRVHPETRAADLLKLDDKTLKAWRKAGYTAVAAAPQQGIFRGSAALLHLGDGGPRANLVLEDAGQIVAFEHGSFGDDSYPGSLMGAIAVIRQTSLDADYYLAAWQRFRAAPALAPRPEANRALAALGAWVERGERAVFVTDTLLDLVHAGEIKREFGWKAVAVASGQEYRHLDWVKDAGMPLLVPLAFPAAPVVGKDGPALDISSDDLRHWRLAPENPARLHAAGIEFAFTAHRLEGPEEIAARLRETIERGLPPDAALAALTRVPAALLGVSDRLGTLASGKTANLTVTDGDLFAAKTKVTEVWIDGNRYEIPAGKTDAEEKDAKGGADAADVDKKQKGKDRDAKSAAAIPWAPPLAPLASPPAVLVRGATIWTSGPQGTLESSDLLVRDGKVAAVGRGLEAPAGAEVIEARGRHVTAGLVDAHSHSATAGDVNEGTHSVTAEVRIADTLDPDSEEILRLLAGGLTSANVLHGSANAIGGQNAVIKMRLGASPQGLLLAGAPPGIKFALGENPKQSNWGNNDLTRYPKSRMGVEEVIRQAFLAARDYDAARRRPSAARGEPVEPRRDLQLEALAEVLAGKRLVHAHSYRQDEILALLDLAKEFGVRIASLQHVLEGYKVGREIAAHGAGASTFSDWWAYKFEVYDAIPYNGALMHADGVVVSFNSDSGELARRLNLEAAKAVKYGGVPPAEALQFVTLNPAKQLGLADRIGSLEPGKDGDFVIWSGDPLSTRSVADQTWVDGRLEFDRARDQEARRVLASEREALIAAARREAKPEKESRPRDGSGGGPPGADYERALADAQEVRR